MHNDLRDMGRSIERQRPRQRFWDAVDVRVHGPKQVAQLLLLFLKVSYLL